MLGKRSQALPCRMGTIVFLSASLVLFTIGTPPAFKIQINPVKLIVDNKFADERGQILEQIGGACFADLGH